MSVRRRRLLVAAAVVLVPLPVGLALTDAHLAAAPAALVVSTAAAALAVSALAVQPLLAGSGRLRWHRVLGAVALALVLIHLGGLFVVGAEDTLFALSLDGPTRGRMATLATIALIAVVALGIARARLPMSGPTWRILHGFLAVLVVGLGFGHAVLTDGALDGFGTSVLLAFATVALLGIAGAYVTRTRRAARGAGPLQRRPPP